MLELSIIRATAPPWDTITQISISGISKNGIDQVSPALEHNESVAQRPISGVTNYMVRYKV